MYADRKIGASHETYVFVIDAIVDHVITSFSRQLRRFCCSRSFVNNFLLIDRYVVILLPFRLDRWSYEQRKRTNVVSRAKNVRRREKGTANLSPRFFDRARDFDTPITFLYRGQQQFRPVTSFSQLVASFLSSTFLSRILAIKLERSMRGDSCIL